MNDSSLLEHADQYRSATCHKKDCTHDYEDSPRIQQHLAGVISVTARNP